jgi:YbbR domain-containing protein
MSDFIRRRILPNFGLRLLSLAFAVALWMGVAHDPIAEVAVEVPIEFHNMPANLEISSENIPRLQIRLRGPQRMIRRLQPSDVYADIDLSALKPGERTFDLAGGQQIHQPRGLEVVQVIPGQFHVAFDTRIARDVDVHARVIGSAAAGYKIGQVVVDPPRITIRGPEKHVSAVEDAITDPVDVSGAMGHMSFNRHAYVSDPLVQVTNPNPVRVTVMMEKAPAATSAP